MLKCLSIFDFLFQVFPTMENVRNSLEGYSGNLLLNIGGGEVVNYPRFRQLPGQPEMRILKYFKIIWVTRQSYWYACTETIFCW